MEGATGRVVGVVVQEAKKALRLPKRLGISAPLMMRSLTILRHS